MCHAVLVVKYKKGLEPNATVTVPDADTLETRLAEFKARDTVECIEVHKLVQRIQLVARWETEEVG